MPLPKPKKAKRIQKKLAEIEEQAEGKKRIGRPPRRLSPEELETVEKLGGFCFDFEQVARWLNIPKRTFEWMVERYPEVLAAYKKGIDESYMHTVGKLREGVEEGDMTAIIFYLKTRFQWRERDKASERDQANVYEIKKLLVEQMKIWGESVKASLGGESGCP